MTIEFTAIEFASADEALQHYYADPKVDRVIQLNGRHYALKQAEAERLEAAGVSFAYVFDRDRADGKNVIVTVPVN